MDLRTFELKPSVFNFSVGPITDWKCSYQSYQQRINFLNERNQILRFENHSCEWKLFEVADIERDPNALRPEGAKLLFDDEQDELDLKGE